MASIHIPQTAKTRPWNEIEEHFTKWFHGIYADNIAKLVGHIISSGLCERLFAFTSMDKLVIANYEPIDWNKDTLNITFHHDEQKWTFEYFASPFKKAEFVRIYPADKGIEKFDNFVEMIGW